MSNKYYYLNEDSRKVIGNSYLLPGETPEGRVRDIAENAEKILGIEGFAEKFENYAALGYYILSTPVWSNFGRDRGRPVSCFGSYVGDSVPRILQTISEVGVMSKLGGGTSAYFGDVRGRGEPIKNNGESMGAVHFMELVDKAVSTISQGSTRRGSISPYLPIDHPDIREFLAIGTEGHPIQKLTHGVCIPDGWMRSMIDGDKEKRDLWRLLLKCRGERGYPYIFFSDHANNGRPQLYKDKNMPILASNLCSEIMLPSSDNESFVCVLSSMNVAKWDEWKDTDAVETLVYFLDAVNQEFIDKLAADRDSDEIDRQLTFQAMERAYNFAVRHRALGLGAAGLHTLYQENSLPFDSKEAAKLNYEVFSTIQKRSYKASEELAELFGECEMTKGYGRRNTTLNAIAPNTTSAFVIGQVSQSIEPIFSNLYIKDLAKIKATMKNPTLQKLLAERGKDTREVWDSIAKADGSVQHLDFLTDHEKKVFLTFAEIPQAAIVNQAAIRQGYLDQGQSLNLRFHQGYTPKDINKITLLAWEMGLKALYYQRSSNAAKELARKRISTECEACN